MGLYIADHLVQAGHEVLVVEQDAATARRARASGGRTVVAGDACEPSVLDRLGLDTVDTVVAATGDDEDNLVVSLLVKRWYGVPRVVARVNNPKNTWMFTDEWGVDTAVSAPAVMTWLLERAVGVQDVVALLRAERGRGVALVELTLDDDAPVLGRGPAELGLPAGATVVAVVRGDQVLAGADAGPFEPGDEVLALTTLQAEPDLRRLLGGQPAAPTPPPADRPPAVHCPLETGCSAAWQRATFGTWRPRVQIPASRPDMTAEPTGRRGWLWSGDFGRFWLGQTISNLGSSFTFFALPLLVFKLTGSALNLAITTATDVRALSPVRAGHRGLGRPGGPAAADDRHRPGPGGGDRRHSRAGRRRRAVGRWIYAVAFAAPP